MALDVVDHVLLGMAQRQHERFLKQLHDGELRELREWLATKTAANEVICDSQGFGRRLRAGDRDTVDDILGNYERRRQIYRAAYVPVYQSMKS